MSLQLAVATEDLDSSLKKAIGVAAGLEVAGLRLNTRTELNVAHATASALRQTLLYVKERQMKVAGLICPTRHSLHDSEFLEERLDVIRKSMSLARKLETTELLVRCGRVPDPAISESPAPSTSESIDEQANPFSFASKKSSSEPSPAAQFSMLAEILNDLTQHGNHVGCVLNLQLASYDRQPIDRLLSAVKSGPLSICFDPATAVMTGANVVSTFRDLYQHIGYVRGRDALRDIDGAGVEVAVGDGGVDWVQFLPTLQEADFRSWICVERSGGEYRRQDVTNGVSFMKTLIPEPND